MEQTTQHRDEAPQFLAIERKVDGLAEQLDSLTRKVVDLSERCAHYQESLLSRIAALSGAFCTQPVYHPRGVHETVEEFIDCPNCFPPLARALAKRPDKIRGILNDAAAGERGIVP